MGLFRVGKLHRKRIYFYILNYKVGYKLIGKCVNFITLFSEK
jgi:hypothetical protein